MHFGVCVYVRVYELIEIQHANRNICILLQNPSYILLQIIILSKQVRAHLLN